MQAETMQKQRTTSKTKSYICRILLLLGVLLLAMGLWYGVQGYQMYRNDLRTRSFAEGGSTISQQLAKNQYFTQEKTLQRKLAEMFLAHAWEQVCEKQELFALYVNTIYFGDGYTGISEAAEGYFHTTPQQLTDYEAVMLAGLPNAPSAYALQEHADLAEQRMQQVLQAMVANQKLTQSEANEILQEKS